MDLASGYSDSINYGNGYTPLATGAINNNNAEYLRNQAAMALMAQAYNPYANSGGSFGAMTDYYSGLGRDYTTATGGNIFGNASGAPQAANPYAFSGYDDSAGLNPSTAPNGGYNQAEAMWSMWHPGEPYRGGDSFADRFSAAPAITPGLQPQGGDYSAFPNAISAGVDPSRNVNVGNSSFGSRFGAWPDPGTPMYTPADFPGWNPNGLPSAPATAPSTVDPFWQWMRDYTGMGQPGQQQPAWNPWGNTGQQGVTDPMGYGTGGYQGNAIPNWSQPQPQQQQPNNLPWFWQGVRDTFGADPKDQSRLPQDTGTYPGATNPNYQPGGMTPQRPYESWLNAS
jgi:hypothetical protein